MLFPDPYIDTSKPKGIRDAGASLIDFRMRRSSSRTSLWTLAWAGETGRQVEKPDVYLKKWPNLFPISLIWTLISGVWPVLSRVMEIYASDSRIMERTCRTLRFVIRCIGTQSAPLVEPLVQRLVRLYIEHPHSCFLYLVSFNFLIL